MIEFRCNIIIQCNAMYNIGIILPKLVVAVKGLERKGLSHVPSAFCLKDVFQVSGLALLVHLVM